MMQPLKLHALRYMYLTKDIFLRAGWLPTERDLSTSSCRGNFEGAIEDKTSFINRKSPLVSRKCCKDCCHVSHVNIQIIIYWRIILMLNRTDSNKDLQEIGAANYAVLERIRVNRREDHLKVSQCNKQAFNWQSVKKWIMKFCRISSQAQKWADFVLQVNFILWFLHQFFQPRTLLKTF